MMRGFSGKKNKDDFDKLLDEDVGLGTAPLLSGGGHPAPAPEPSALSEPAASKRSSGFRRKADAEDDFLGNAPLLGAPPPERRAIPPAVPAPRSEPAALESQQKRGPNFRKRDKPAKGSPLFAEDDAVEPPMEPYPESPAPMRHHEPAAQPGAHFLVQPADMQHEEPVEPPARGIFRRALQEHDEEPLAPAREQFLAQPSETHHNEPVPQKRRLNPMELLTREGDIEPLFTPEPKRLIDTHGRRDVNEIRVPGVPKSIRQRYRKRNRRPLRMKAKIIITAVCLTVCFAIMVGLMSLAVFANRLATVGIPSKVTINLVMPESGAYRAARDISGGAGHEDIENFFSPNFPLMSDKSIENILILVSDIHPNQGKTARCDSLLLIALDSARRKTKTVTIMRDLYVPIPGHKSGTINTAYYYDTAAGFSDLRTVRKVFEDSLRVPVDQFIILDQAALGDAVDLVGGILVTLTDDEANFMRSGTKYGKFPRFTQGGAYSMSGSEALAYARMTGVDESPEVRRIGRQQHVLNLIFQQFTRLPAGKMLSLAYTLADDVTTSMTAAELLGMIAGSSSLKKHAQVNYMIPINGSWSRSLVKNAAGDIQEVALANLSFNASELQRFIYDDDPSYIDQEYAAASVKLPVSPVTAPPVSSSDLVAED